MKEIKRLLMCSAAGLLLALISCAPAQKPVTHPIIPALEYSRKIKARYQPVAGAAGQQIARASFGTYQGPSGNYPEVRFVKELPPEERQYLVTNMPEHKENTAAEAPQDFTMEMAPQENIRPYQGPLPLGDPGVTASLWRGSSGNNNLFRDHRAWQPMDLITIVVSESSQGKNNVKTEVKEKSSLLAGVKNLLGFLTGTTSNPGDVVSRNPQVTPSSLINADTQNDFKGEGKISRDSSLTARISAMVVEVLPSGLLRIEGQKIITVNNEEQYMVISGIVRPRDINSDNEVDSSRIAQMRIDYSGRGTAAEAQHGGWLSRMIRIFWPF
ncbi:MAG: flagellar basal body L-ring protein FlgH [Candidatus Dadabacteria bacterium]|nr:MAG: flagellar basal body L-ring protein FlgH [Candidatus Dadabacteria bacterium]